MLVSELYYDARGARCLFFDKLIKITSSLGVPTVLVNCANIPNLLSEVWFDPGDRVGSNDTPEGWLIFGREFLDEWMHG